MTLVADVGLLGVPNAGKSTLLRAVTRARPKVANYPFTTLIPNLGVCEMASFGLKSRPMVWLDIPGLIEGAAAGKGLGLAFLRHTERCRLLLHLIDGESDDPVGDLTSINAELARYSDTLRDCPQVVVLTKTDLPHVAEIAEATVHDLKAASGHGRILAISSQGRRNLKTLLTRTSAFLAQVEAGEERADRPGTLSTVPIGIALDQQDQETRLGVVGDDNDDEYCANTDEPGASLDAPKAVPQQEELAIDAEYQ